MNPTPSGEPSGRLSGKVAVVTGGGTSYPDADVCGVGQAICVLLARAGAAVVLLDRDEEAAKRTEQQVLDQGGRCHVVVGDVSARADCQRTVDEAVARFGALDVLVNSAAIGEPAVGVATMDEADLDRMLAINLKGPFLMSQAAIPAMRARGGGAIVNITSIAARRGGGISAYAATKGGLESLTIDLAASLGADGIRVNAVSPGQLLTPMASRLSRVDDRIQKLRRETAPLGTTGTAWDIAWAVLFLASDEARWITGVSLPVDAGLLTAIPLVMMLKAMGEAVPGHTPSGKQ